MTLPKVRDVMTDRVVAVREVTPYKEIVAALTRFGVSAVPVIDADQRVVGIVSEADLMAKVEFADAEAPYPLFERRRRRATRQKAAGDRADELMTAPAITTRPDKSIADAARLMDTEAVKRLPVVGDDGRLVGIVARSDLLRMYIRPDEAIRQEVYADVLGRVLCLEPGVVDVSVERGVVTLRGTVDRRSTAAIAVRLVHAVAGVVDAVDELGFDYDDTADVRRHYTFDAETPRYTPPTI
jgi:CBS domain-containing protein